MPKKRKPTMKLFKYRLGVFISQQHSSLKSACPMMRSWWNIKEGVNGLWTEKPCYICREFMEVHGKPVCPCFYYSDCISAIDFAFKKLKKED